MKTNEDFLATGDTNSNYDRAYAELFALTDEDPFGKRHPEDGRTLLEDGSMVKGDDQFNGSVVFEDAFDEDELIVDSRTADTGERYIGIVRPTNDGEREHQQGVVLTAEQQVQLAHILLDSEVDGSVLNRTQEVRRVLVAELIDKTLSGNVFGGSALGSEHADAVLKLALYIEGGFSWLKEVASAN